MGEEGMPDGEWPSLDFGLDMGSDFDLGDLGNLEDLLDADFEREFENFKREPSPGRGRRGGSRAALRGRGAACIIRGAVPRPIGQHRT